MEPKKDEENKKHKSEELLKYLRGQTSFSEWQTKSASTENVDMELEITGETAAVELPVKVKEEPADDVMDAAATNSSMQQGREEQQTCDDDGDEDVVYLGTEIVLRYLQGEMTFEEFDAVMQAEVKEEDEDLQVELAQEEVHTLVEEEQKSADSDTAATSDGKTRAPREHKPKKPRERLPRRAQGLMGEANMRFARGEKEDAIRICMEVIKMASNAPEPYQTLGMIYEETGDMERSLQFLLIAAHLNRDNADEWVQLAEVSLEQGSHAQALSCYNRAIRLDKKNMSLYWARCDLLQKAGEERKVMDDHQTILTLYTPDQGEEYFKLALHLTKNLHSHNELDKAFATLSKACALHPRHVTAEGVNVLLEMLLSRRQYADAVTLLVQHNGVVLRYQGDRTIKGSADSPPDPLPTTETPTGCDIPAELLVDLRAKLAICCIHLGYTDCTDMAMCRLLTENAEEIGDLYLDVAEAYIDRGQHKQAKPLLYTLVNTDDYNLAAVWLQYAECLNALGELTAAARAFEQVLEQAPGHRSARLSLSGIQQQLGKPEQALKVLEQGEQESGGSAAADDQLALDLQLQLPKCMLLYSQKRHAEFITAARGALFGAIPGVFSSPVQKITITTRSHKYRNETFAELGQESGDDDAGRLFDQLREMTRALSKEKLITHGTLWNLLLKLLEVLMAEERFAEMEEVAIAALIHPAFLTEDYQRDIDFIVVHSCLLSGQGTVAFDFVRDLCLDHLENNQAWNLFAQIINISKNMRHNRFCLRLMFKYPDHKALGLLNGHNALVAGTYKHALAEYVTAFRNRPEDPFHSFCLGITFVHLASQRFAAKRHSLTVQACAFFNQYLELRGECQETYYNMGRAMHQLGLLHAAVFYYDKGLQCPPMVPGDGKFDLSRELAYNLSLIYRQSGSYDKARLITQRHLVI